MRTTRILVTALLTFLALLAAVAVGVASTTGEELATRERTRATLQEEAGDGEGSHIRVTASHSVRVEESGQQGSQHRTAVAREEAAGHASAAVEPGDLVREQLRDQLRDPSCGEVVDMSTPGDQLRDQLRDGSCDSTCDGTPDQERDRLRDATGDGVPDHDRERVGQDR